MDTPQETRWLDDEEMATWLCVARMIMLLPAALDAQLQRDAGLTHFEYLVLSMLSEAPGRTRRMSELAAVANGSLSRLSHVVSRLEKRGWVLRSPDPEDGRFTLAALTDDGWQKIVATAPGHVEAVRTMVLDPLTRAQARQVGEISKRILAAIAPDGCAT